MKARRQQMKAIKQQKQREDSSFNSLDSESRIEEKDIIQQYNNLDFSDEMSRMDKDDFSSEEGELSQDKLMYLGVDKFPGSYSHQFKDVSDTRIGNNNTRSHKQDKGKSRNQKSRNHNHSSFNIDSFLNSRPSNESSSDSERKKHNINPLKKVLQQESQASRPHKQYLAANFKKSKIEQKNNEIRDFIAQYNRKNSRAKSSKNWNSSSNSYYSNQSIALITLPEPQQSFKKEEKKKLPYYLGTDEDSVKKAQLQQIRFEQARINFMDSFLPETMKIGSNPYQFLKYINSRPRGLQRMV